MKRKITKEYLSEMFSTYGEDSLEIDGVTLSIEYDEYAESPVELYDSLGTMRLRGVQGHEDMQGSDLYENLLDLVQRKVGVENKHDDWSNKRIKYEFERLYYHLPVYVYSHGGSTVSTTPFSCRWDSGLAGVIYIDKDKASEEFELKKGKKLKDKVLACLKCEVETYAKYLEGQCYYIKIEWADDYETVGGFIGDHGESGAFDHLVDMYNDFVTGYNRTRIQHLKILIKNRVPLLTRKTILEKSA